MTTPIVTLNPKPVPQNTPRPPKPPASAPKLLAETAFPKKAPVGTRPPNRESGHGELGRRRRSDRRTSRSARPESSPQSKSPEAPPVSRSRSPGALAELERRLRNLELRQKDWVESVRIRGELEYLAVAENGSGQYWITVEGTGKPFVRESFATPGFCWECAVEIEETFEVLQVIELRSPLAMEWIGEMVQAGLERERVARVWGWSAEFLWYQCAGGARQMSQTAQGLRMLESISRTEFGTSALLIERQTKGWSHFSLCRWKTMQ